MKEAMKIEGRLAIAPGEIWAIESRGSETDAWLEALARKEELEDSSSLVSFAQQAGQSAGWPQARYYADDGASADEFLSYDSVWEVNPFEVGARRPEARKTFRERMARLSRLLELGPLAEKPLLSLSNGEMRRVLLARALAKGPKLLILDDPAAGLDAARRVKLKGIVEALAKRGLAAIWAWRHSDELPANVSRFFTLKGGRLQEAKAPGVRVAAVKKAPHKAKSSSAKPVIEINHLDLAIAGRTLFKDFSWTVRKGERWLLRGENGSGKTTLFALITGDSPLAYACDVRVFGQKREVGVELGKIRRRIGMASPEIQAASGKSAAELVDEALSGRPDLLLLDEPFMNMTRSEAKAASRKIANWLKDRPGATAVLISHRADESPRSFNHILDLA